MHTVVSLTGRKFPVRFLFLSVCMSVLGVVFAFMFGYDWRTKAYAEWNGTSYSTAAGSIGEMRKLAENFGIGIDGQSVSAEKIRIPMTFNELYEEYNALQKPIGMDLEPYRGEECMQYRFDVGEDMYLHFIVFDGHFIGGDLSEKEWNGTVRSIG